jgi:hypothetical protein
MLFMITFINHIHDHFIINYIHDHFIINLVDSFHFQ